MRAKCSSKLLHLENNTLAERKSCSNSILLFDACVLEIVMGNIALHFDGSLCCAVFAQKKKINK